jgi:hypothetical protein
MSLIKIKMVGIWNTLKKIINKLNRKYCKLLNKEQFIWMDMVNIVIIV